MLILKEKLGEPSHSNTHHTQTETTTQQQHASRDGVYFLLKMELDSGILAVIQEETLVYKFVLKKPSPLLTDGPPK